MNNPYAAPEAPLHHADTSHGDLYWRSGPELLTRTDCVLPDRCVKCNDAAAKKHRHTFYWHSPWWYVLIPVSLLFYAIAASLVRKKAVVTVGLCQRHEGRRRKHTWIALGLFGLGLLVLFAGMTNDIGMAVWLGLFAIVVSPFWALIGRRLMIPVRIEDQLARFKGCSNEFLSTLPSRHRF